MTHLKFYINIRHHQLIVQQLKVCHNLNQCSSYIPILSACFVGVMQAYACFPLGIWTDGTWVFSTGLDQRVRCWKMGLTSQFTEYSHVIISVPEPETLDVFHDR